MEPAGRWRYCVSAIRPYETYALEGIVTFRKVLILIISFYLDHRLYMVITYNALGHKLRFAQTKKVQFPGTARDLLSKLGRCVTVWGIVLNGPGRCLHHPDQKEAKMAKVKLHPLFAQLSGGIGDIVFRTTKEGQVIISQRPRRSSAGPSEAQKAQQERFAGAVAYAKAALADPRLRGVYEEMAAKEGKAAFAMARSDYFKGRNLLER